MHLDLRIGRLHPDDKLLDVVRQTIDVIAFAFEAQNGCVVRCSLLIFVCHPCGLNLHWDFITSSPCWRPTQVA